MAGKTPAYAICVRCGQIEAVRRNGGMRSHAAKVDRNRPDYPSPCLNYAVWPKDGRRWHSRAAAEIDIEQKRIIKFANELRAETPGDGQ